MRGIIKTMRGEVEHEQMATEGRLLAHDLLMQVSWSNISLTHTFIGATEPYDSQGGQTISFNGSDIKITSAPSLRLR
jgi:hypothetical protein